MQAEMFILGLANGGAYVVFSQKISGGNYSLTGLFCP
jgi:hypothetical protein